MIEDPLSKIRHACLSLPETNERLSHGEPSWFIRDKKLFAMYANTHHDDRVALWLAGAEGVQQELMESAPDRFFYPAYVGHRGWIGAYLDVPTDWDELGELIIEAFRTVAPKLALALLEADSEPHSPPTPSLSHSSR